LLGIVLSAWQLAAGAGAAAPSLDAAELARLLELAQNQVQEARSLGARRDLPVGFAGAEEALAKAETEQAAASRTGSSEQYAAAVRDAALQAERLVSRARWVKELRSARQPWEDAVNRFDETLRDIGRAAHIEIDPALTGPAAAQALLRALDKARVSQRVVTDSLALVHRLDAQRCQSKIAAQESTLVSLQVEVSHLRHQLWETELRAGMAEADRSAAESDLNLRREREEAIQRIGQAFGPQEAEVLLTPEGNVIIRVFGFSFAVGSAELSASKRSLIDKLIEAVQLFPGAKLQVEGHTDNTGGRDLNLILSRRRAETVAHLLAVRLDLPEEDIQVTGYGPDRPIATNSTPDGRARNRRIDVVISAGLSR
jgi:outer membrane protein OmpA-like peptidoglycan-associated protein